MRFISSLFLTFVTLAFATSALAVLPGVVGERNFERALRAEYARKDLKAATEYYTKAAKGFRQLMEQNRQEGDSTRTSQLVMAGICQYKAGMYEDAASTMQVVASMDDRIWEAFLYGGLARAMLGDEKGALGMWRAFPPSTSLRRLGPMIRKQVAALDAGTTTLQDAARTIDTAGKDQFRWNYYNPTTSQRSLAPPEQCDGRFWWRHNQSPCELDTDM